MNAVRQDPAPAESQGLFKGIAVVIDDGLKGAPRDGPDGIEAIVKAIHDAGSHAVMLDTLPTRDEELDNFANAAFFVMDWNLHGSKLDEVEEGQAGDAAHPDFNLRGLDIGGLKDEYEQENVDFLTKLRERRHAPVFIFTNEDVVHVTEVLRDGGLIGENLGSHILVKSKRDVGENLFNVLEEWIKQTPSALVLKQWERHQTLAVNQLFKEFHDQHKYWPVIFWNSFKQDGVSPAPELGELITRLVAARMKPLSANLDEFSDAAMEHFGANDAKYRQALHEVLQAERLLPNDLLEDDSYSTGDLFFDQNGNAPRYFLNIRAACDCIKREGYSQPDLYLIRGTIVEGEELAKLARPDLGNFHESDVETIVFALHQGRSVVFKFRTLAIKPINKLHGVRVGRMLAPFLTRVTQRFGAYSHRSGLPRIPTALMPSDPPVAAGNGPAANEGDPTPCDCA
ncbi:hypothetical protein ABQE95_01360 [Xanthomonas campestris pv. campestris]|uniref:hypothetical protein n=1 Tax=Xanthomonas campestris TaxID=339 RepID=UPI0016088312|nr:hypothetical protein [Xanthomonas campestris]MEB1196465.1 hypothetical protein [Xanthomonas campestris pv. campestris]MEA9531929.1 hypothetical protein [Xanthomonas campestris]MEB1267676.1 hypothetical protein [Xanthomonas campestris pv. campestris]MEB1279690.1 hypothetical protein [Xanthomonas campestris pv. campestris]MEB1342255.1 hypothetical protein [Xanthomonas campestris pv. campestris]